MGGVQIRREGGSVNLIRRLSLLTLTETGLNPNRDKKIAGYKLDGSWGLRKNSVFLQLSKNHNSVNFRRKKNCLKKSFRISFSIEKKMSPPPQKKKKKKKKKAPPPQKKKKKKKKKK